MWSCWAGKTADTSAPPPSPPPAGVCPDMSSGEATGQCRRRETWRVPKLKQLASRLIFYFLSLSQQWATCKLWRIKLPLWKSTVYFNSKLNGKDVLTILIAFLRRARWQCGCLPWRYEVKCRGWPAATEPESLNQNSVTADKTVTHAMQQSDHLGTINFSIWQDTVQKQNIFCHQSVFKWLDYYPEQLIK